MRFYHPQHHHAAKSVRIVYAPGFLTGGIFCQLFSFSSSRKREWLVRSVVMGEMDM